MVYIYKLMNNSDIFYTQELQFIHILHRHVMMNILYNDVNILCVNMNIFNLQKSQIVLFLQFSPFNRN